MTPEDTNKIVAAIDRNTEATREVAVSGLVRNIILFCAFVLAFTEVGCPRAKATPLLPPLTYEIGTPPLPPPNPHVQYWHTQWVPGDGGVYPLEVYAPALPRVEPELYVLVDIGDPPRLMETPEPGTGILVAGVVFLLIAGGYTAHLLDRAENRELDLKLALIDIKHSNDIERSREIARKALEESKS